MGDYKKSKCKGTLRKNLYEVVSNLPHGVSTWNSKSTTRLLSKAKNVANKFFNKGLEGKRKPTSVDIIKYSYYNNKCAQKEMSKGDYNSFVGVLMFIERTKIYTYNKQNPKGKKNK
tara:strand:+ start:175 stop:522 length:348 start_codon:yes stop_codon:yes gene_type:complete